MAQIVVLEGQSLFDLAVQVCGSVETAFAIADLNGSSITDALVPGSLLTVPDASKDSVPKDFNKSISDYYFKNELKPATDEGAGGSGRGLPDMLNEGIDFWAIRVDNVVQ